MFCDFPFRYLLTGLCISGLPAEALHSRADDPSGYFAVCRAPAETESGRRHEVCGKCESPELPLLAKGKPMRTSDPQASEPGPLQWHFFGRL